MKLSPPGDSVEDVTSTTPQQVAGDYRVRTDYRPGDRIAVRYADAEISIDDLRLDSNGPAQ